MPALPALLGLANAAIATVLLVVAAGLDRRPWGHGVVAMAGVTACLAFSAAGAIEHAKDDARTPVLAVEPSRACR